MRFDTLAEVRHEAASSLRAGASETGCLTQLREAEAQGYACAWIAGAAPSLHLVASALCARTGRIRIGVTSRVGPTVHPLRLAEEIAMLDVMSGGRLDWSIGPSSDAWNVFEEQLVVVLRALGGESFSHAGAFFQIPELQCFPAPAQEPHPPLFIRVDTAAALAPVSTGAHAAMIGAAVPASVLRADDSNGRLLIRCVHVAETSARARAEAGPALVAALGVDAAEGDGDCLVAERAIVGDAAECRDRIAGLVGATGIAGLVAWHGFGGLSRDAALASQRRLIEDVAPAFA